MKKPTDPTPLDHIVDLSGMAPKGNRDWSRSSIPGGWWVPEFITIDDGELCWEPRMDAARWVEPTPDLLGQFLQIHQAERWREWYDAVLRFARTWGPLHLCYVHALPAWHRQDKWGLQIGEGSVPVCRPSERRDGRIAEPLWRWLFYSYLARDVVHAGALTRGGNSRLISRTELHIDTMLLVKPDRGQLVAHVHRLIEDGMGFVVRPEWTHDEDVPVWRAEVRTLAAALGVALWNTLRTSPGTAVCAHCLRLFEARQGNRRYCDQPACQRERKRVEKAQLRAEKAASTAPDPEYII